MFTIYNRDYPLGCTPGTGHPCAPTGGTCTKLKGCKRDPWPNSPTTTLGYPNAVPSSSDTSKAYVFVGGFDGRLYRIDISGDPSTYPTISVDTRRPSCTLDTMLAMPAVQLYASSNQAFKSRVDSFGGAHLQDDVVFVVTDAGCGDDTRNRIIAYFASDLSKMWEFNASGTVEVGGGVEQCELDYANNRLFCGTDAPPVSSADSLWALSTIDGSLIWSDSPGGAVLTRPALNNNNNKLYVVSKPGSLWAYNPAGNGLGGPQKVWAAGMSVVSLGAVANHSPWVETRPGTWKDKILVLDSLGTLFAVEDVGSGGTLLWSRIPTDAVQWVSTPVVIPGATESKAYIGRDDGTLQMIKLEGGQPEGIIQIASSMAEDVYDPSVDTDLTTGQAVVVVGGNRVARITVPICPDDPGAGAGLGPTVPLGDEVITPAGTGSCDDCDSCTVDLYDSVGRRCTHVPANCDDQNLCTIDGCIPATGQCAHVPVSCDDSDACTADSCGPATGECLHAPIVLMEPTPAQFVSNTSVQWPPTADATHWNSYRGTVPATMLGSRPPGAEYDHVCHESGDALGDGPTTSTDAAAPPVGAAFYYLVSGEAACEGAVGHASSGATIPNVSPCPTPP